MSKEENNGGEQEAQAAETDESPRTAQTSDEDVDDVFEGNQDAAEDGQEETEGNNDGTDESGTDQEPGEDEGDIRQDNIDRRTDWREELSGKTGKTREALETGAQTEEDAVGKVLEVAEDAGESIGESQDNIEETSRSLAEFADERKKAFEDNFAEREEEVSYNQEAVEENAGAVTGVHLPRLGDNAVNKGYILNQFKSVKSQNDVFRSEEGSANQGYIDEGDELAENISLFEDLMQGNREDAQDEVDALLDEIDLDTQLEELQDRKETYDEVKQTVEGSIQTLEEADTSIDQGDWSDEDWGDAQELIDSIGEDRDDMASDVNFDLSEYGDPVEGLQLLKASVSDAVKKQQERLYEAHSVVDQLRSDLVDTIGNYQDFVDDVSDLTAADQISEDRAKEIKSELDVDSVMDLADMSAKNLRTKAKARGFDGNLQGGHAENVLEGARERVNELASKYGLSEITDSLEEWVDEEVSQEEAVRKQLSGLYETAETVEQYVGELVEILPEDGEYLPEWEEDGETYTAEEWIDQERSEAYEALGMEVPDTEGLLS